MVRRRAFGDRGVRSAREPGLHPRVLTRYVLPSLNASLGQQPLPPERVALGEAVTVNPPLTFFLPVRLEQDDWGRSWAMPAPTNGSGDFTALAGTAGFVELPPGPNTYPKGFVTRLYRWS
ncbi:MAG: hypothetical protein E6K45_02445 [Gammaproteobacteria bacterium]|nr:MAG: hypothetical protein E6K45_02445 [Gammaproteobacteria bacterium]